VFTVLVKTIARISCHQRVSLNTKKPALHNRVAGFMGSLQLALLTSA
jgi:hypothetical protein